MIVDDLSMPGVSADGTGSRTDLTSSGGAVCSRVKSALNHNPVLDDSVFYFFYQAETLWLTGSDMLGKVCDCTRVDRSGSTDIVLCCGSAEGCHGLVSLSHNRPFDFGPVPSASDLASAIAADVSSLIGLVCCSGTDFSCVFVYFFDFDCGDIFGSCRVLATGSDRYVVASCSEPPQSNVGFHFGLPTVYVGFAVALKGYLVAWVPILRSRHVGNIVLFDRLR